MTTITFSYSPNYEQKEVEARDLQPSLEYRVEIPDNTFLSVSDVYHHVDAWLRGLGYIIPEL